MKGPCGVSRWSFLGRPYHEGKGPRGDVGLFQPGDTCVTTRVSFLRLQVQVVWPEDSPSSLSPSYIAAKHLPPWAALRIPWDQGGEGLAPGVLPAAGCLMAPP